MAAVVMVAVVTVVDIMVVAEAITDSAAVAVAVIIMALAVGEATITDLAAATMAVIITTGGDIITAADGDTITDGTVDGVEITGDTVGILDHIMAGHAILTMAITTTPIIPDIMAAATPAIQEATVMATAMATTTWAAIRHLITPDMAAADITMTA
jgi:hypothetical protein